MPPATSGIAVTCALACLLLAASSNAAGQDRDEIVIEQIEWGFNGKAVVLTFTPLSVLISNPGINPAEGTLQLSRAIQLTQRVGAICEEDYYISPGESRWVQFTPYILGDWENWTLNWGAARHQREPSLQLGLGRHHVQVAVRVGGDDGQHRPVTLLVGAPQERIGRQGLGTPSRREHELQRVPVHDARGPFLRGRLATARRGSVVHAQVEGDALVSGPLGEVRVHAHQVRQG